MQVVLTIIEGLIAVPKIAKYIELLVSSIITILDEQRIVRIENVISKVKVAKTKQERRKLAYDLRKSLD